MGYSPPQEYTPVESFRTRQTGDVASLSQGALNSFRTEAASDLNNPALVRSLFGGSGETSPSQKYWLDDTFGKVSFSDGGNLAFETAVAQTASRTFSGNQNTID